MRRGLISILTAAVLATAGLATGCSGGGGRPAAESPSSTRSGDVSSSRSAGASPSRGVTPRERDSAPVSPSGTTAPSPPRETATKTVESTATESTKTRSVTRATQTETQTTTQAAAQPVPSAGAESPASASGTSSPLWLWLLLAALVALVVWIVYSASKRSGVERDWNATVTDACAQGAALHDAIIVAEMSGLETNADGRWSDIQRRADGLNETLYMLRATAPTDDERLRVDDTLAALQAVRLTITPQRAPDAADRAQAEGIQDRLRTFDNALRALRASGGR